MSHIRVTIGERVFTVQGFVNSVGMWDSANRHKNAFTVERRDVFTNATSCADDVFQRISVLDNGQPWRMFMGRDSLILTTGANATGEGIILEGTKVEIRKEIIAHLRMMQAVAGDAT